MTEGRKILIVDDDPVTRRLLHGALSAESFTTVLATDAMAALAMTRKEEPDLILLDLGLPAGGGFLFLERLAQFPKLALIPVVVISGQDRKVNEPKAIAAGVVAYLSKPFLHEQVIETVKRVLSVG